MTKPNPRAWVDHRHKCQEHFLARCREMHGDKFDYSRFEYVRAKVKGTIICPVHGAFEQMPDKHLARHSKGCPQCAVVAGSNSRRGKRSSYRPAKITPNEFLRRARSRYGDRYEYDLSGYDGLTKGHIVITCPTHGPFTTTPQVHLLTNQTTGCPQCGFEQRNRSKTGTYAEFATDSRKVHGDQYEYPESNVETYKTRRSKVEIVCPKHGSFRMSAQKHLGGQRCRRCSVDELIENDRLVGGYSEWLFRERPDLKELPATLYYLCINGGQLYKVGITRTEVVSRIAGIHCKASGAIKTIEEIDRIDLPLYEAFKLEQFILRHCKEHRAPQRWTSEAFSQDIRPMLSSSPSDHSPVVCP